MNRVNTAVDYAGAVNPKDTRDKEAAFFLKKTMSFDKKTDIYIDSG